MRLIFQHFIALKCRFRSNLTRFISFYKFDEAAIFIKFYHLVFYTRKFHYKNIKSSKINFKEHNAPLYFNLNLKIICYILHKILRKEQK